MKTMIIVIIDILSGAQVLSLALCLEPMGSLLAAA
jgi:hypothetical protein